MSAPTDPKPPFAETMTAISAEVLRARTKFPSGRFRLAAIVEEVGELAEAIAAGDKRAAKTEAIQVAACAVRLIEEGDATTYVGWGVIRLVINVGNVARALLQRKDPRRHLGFVISRADAITMHGDPSFNDITDAEAKA